MKVAKRCAVCSRKFTGSVRGPATCARCTRREVEATAYYRNEAIRSLTDYRKYRRLAATFWKKVDNPDLWPLRMAVGSNAPVGCVTLSFSFPIAFVQLTSDQAIELAKTLLVAARNEKMESAEIEID